MQKSGSLPYPSWLMLHQRVDPPSLNQLPLKSLCCSPNSKFSDTSMAVTDGCRIVQFTEKHNPLDEKYRDYVADIVNTFPGGKPVLLWLSLPCTGGTSWSFVNLKVPSAAKKVLRHVKLFKKLWKAVAGAAAAGSRVGWRCTGFPLLGAERRLPGRAVPG